MLVLLVALAYAGLEGYIISRYVHHSVGAWEILRLISGGVASAYVVVLSLFHASTKTVALHARLTYHICVTALFAMIHWYLYSFGNSLSPEYHRPPMVEDFAALGVVTLLLFASATIPLGPLLHQDLSKVYNKAVAVKIKEAEATGDDLYTNTFAPNVNEEVSASILSKLIFHYAYPMIAKTSAMDQADIQDVPAAHAYFRTQNVIHDSVHVNSKNGVRTNLGPTFALLYTVWAPEWAAVLKGELSMPQICRLPQSVYLSSSCALYGISRTSASRRSWRRSTSRVQR